MFSFVIQDENKMLCQKNFFANFSHILGHQKIFVFQNNVFGPSKQRFWTVKNPFFMLKPQIFMYMKNKTTA